MVFKLRPKARPTFIKHPMFHPKDDYVGDLYKLIYHPPIPLSVFEAQGIWQPSKALYLAMVNAIKAAKAELYQIPAVRSYYGAEFIHGFGAKYDTTIDGIRYLNLDDTLEAEHFTKEMAVIIMEIFKQFLDSYDCYIYYQGEFITVITGTELEGKRRSLEVQERLAWDRDYDGRRR